MRIEMIGPEYTSFAVCFDCKVRFFHRQVNPAKVEIIIKRPGIQLCCLFVGRSAFFVIFFFLINVPERRIGQGQTFVRFYCGVELFNGQIILTQLFEHYTIEI